jgi:hypothetical protein
MPIVFNVCKHIVQEDLTLLNNAVQVRLLDDAEQGVRGVHEVLPGPVRQHLRRGPEARSQGKP